MLCIDYKSKKPIYKQIYEQIKDDILMGKLTVGTRLTSTRVLAQELKIGRNTVENAYAQLVLEGYITSLPSSGYLVNNLQIHLNPKIPINIREEEVLDINENQKVEKSRYNFSYGNLDGVTFPSKIWKRYTADLLNNVDNQVLHSYSNVKGDLELRIQLMQYLYHSRGVQSKPEQIVICSGTQSALEIIIKLFPNFEKKVAIEEPCYDGSKIVFQSNECELIPIRVNENGIVFSQLTASGAKMLYISPSHQFPTGAIMPIYKRLKILDWAREFDNIIIEDDYDSEFRYNGQPIPSLQSIDRYERVIYLGTFSKILSPGLRISYMILPNWLLPIYEQKLAGYQCTVPIIEQKILAKLMADGYWEKHVRKTCLAQKRKHDILIKSIKQNMGNKVKIYGQQAGLHIYLEFLEGQQEETLVKKAWDYDIKVCPVSPFWLNKEEYHNNALILGYGMISEEDIPKAVEILSMAWFN